ncbi:C45 family autoproteolytic acyltransferase/hydolase [Salinimicrobium terrae]|uniref:C45 family autoproteolytic acyltransferase/hydolase n=1 Tax=Salinimicrobium terrae TaxID=470866 RepID=UPI000428B136|nr:C45 family peptidase [Salinimicrobium terrae]
MKLHFRAISEPGEPGLKWQKLFNTHWPAYKAWYNSKGKTHYPDLKTSQAALKKYMPEMWPTYKRLCKLAGADAVAARFLTGFQPPAYISGCSQAVITGEEVQLVRNYDYHPDLSEGTQLRTAWNGKKVIATSDCLIGVLDGMNEDGLAISLTFGGRKEVGTGFGIPMILRYVLEFCSNVEEAVKALTHIPSHMSYNVTVVDKTGAFKTVRLAPDRAPVVTDATFVTNHQGKVDWPENAAFNKTVERSAFLKSKLSEKGMNAEKLANSFLESPLYNTKFSDSFGTLYTAVYRPMEGVVQLRWPGDYVLQSFEDFEEMSRIIDFDPASANKSVQQPTPNPVAMDAYQPPIQKFKERKSPTDWQEKLCEIMVDAMAAANPSADKKQLNKLRENLMDDGQVSWQAMANFWSNPGKGSRDSWDKRS